MAVIHILDDQLANQIAAGEVVERPASVVKELVENAIDAGSSRIDIVVEEGGLQLIQVKDNGAGMAEDDVETAFLRHATSKILTNRDLFSIRSLGFRGEALPSIAAVSKLEMLTSTDNSGLGRLIQLEGGRLIKHEAAAAMQGTMFTVRELFYNTPARLKYMKSIQTELGHVSDLIYRLALSYPNISFTLKHNDHTLLQTLGNGDLLQVIAAIYGVHTAKQMVPIQAEQLDYNISGYIGKPELTRSNRNALSWFVNGRYVRSYSLNQAALRAYHTLLPINRFPIIVMQVNMHPTLVDVNVHPSKMEVRFSKEAELADFIEKSLRQELVSKPLIPRAASNEKAKVKTFVEQEQWSWAAATDERGVPIISRGALVPNQQASSHAGEEVERRPSGSNDGSIKEPTPSSAVYDHSGADKSDPSAAKVMPAKAVEPQLQRDESTAWSELQPLPTRAVHEERQGYGESAADALPSHTSSSQEALTSLQDKAETASSSLREGDRHHEEASQISASQERPQTSARPSSYVGSRDRGTVNRDKAQVASWNRVLDKPVSDVSLPPFPALSLIGQLHGTYLICGNEEGLYLIDQHAAHERINYEYYVEAFGKPIEASQELFIPITLEYTPNEADRIRERMHLLEQVGIVLEPFGTQTFLIRSHPYWFPSGEEEALIHEMMEWVLKEKSPDIRTMREASAIMCSCKASIKANQRISDAEAETLIARLGACHQPYTCPHGRPIVVKFTTYDLEKMFKRVM
ncbi:DNA mismatch repair endonuclease MutL [Paenibacillus aquistagni]|uniref:DNA mismatch repair endonuclease MutL n=1 Tax=Paenibacillus aquistagni TaxID=1852522 RepID=UPI00145BA7D2|nr:DNA mismatch repair endonuclease MutL [Paenibacillus aquistagni]NMM54243.1 DNA mismatch repair endonuclease MutL [Paenibacillus aquistagni]